MKRILLLFISVITLSGVQASGGKDIGIANVTIDKDGSILKVGFDISLDKFRSNERISLTPVIYNGEGGWVSLEPITLVGKRRDIYDRRTGIDRGGDRHVVNRRKQPVVSYSATVPYEEWMQYVSLAVDMVCEGCLVQTDELLQDIVEPSLLHYTMAPHYDVKPLRYELTELEKYDLDNPFLHPMEDYSKRYDILLKDRSKGSSVVIFSTGSHKLDMTVQENKNVLEALRRAFTLISEDPNATLKHIMIAGYASPEGTLAFNTALAKRRAETVKEFIKSILRNPDDNLFELYNGREDWDGLREQVDNSDMEDKAAILDIIDSYTIEQEIRKVRLKQFGGGEPYKYMLANFYPSLRSAGYVQVYYEIDRRATVATAVKDEFGRMTWVDPDSPANRGVTVINRSLEYMVAEKFDEALDILMEFKDDPRAWNNIGVCYMMTGRYDEADAYFAKAAANGDENASGNMEQTAWARKLNSKS